MEVVPSAEMEVVPSPEMEVVPSAEMEAPLLAEEEATEEGAAPAAEEAAAPAVVEAAEAVSIAEETAPAAEEKVAPAASTEAVSVAEQAALAPEQVAQALAIEEAAASLEEAEVAAEATAPAERVAADAKVPADTKAAAHAQAEVSLEATARVAATAVVEAVAAVDTASRLTLITPTPEVGLSVEKLPHSRSHDSGQQCKVCGVGKLCKYQLCIDAARMHAALDQAEEWLQSNSTPVPYGQAVREGAQALAAEGAAIASVAPSVEEAASAIVDGVATATAEADTAAEEQGRVVGQEATVAVAEAEVAPNSCLLKKSLFPQEIDISQEIDTKLVAAEANLNVTDKHHRTPLADAPVAAAPTCTEEKLRTARARVLRASGGKIACFPQLLSSGANTQCKGLKRVSLKWSGDRAEVYHKWERDAATAPRPSERSSKASGQHEAGGGGEGQTRSAVLPPQNHQGVRNEQPQSAEQTAIISTVESFC